MGVPSPCSDPEQAARLSLRSSMFVSKPHDPEMFVFSPLQGAVSGSVQATDRLMKELRDIYRSQSFKGGEFASGRGRNRSFSKDGSQNGACQACGLHWLRVHGVPLEPLIFSLKPGWVLRLEHPTNTCLPTFQETMQSNW